MSLEARVALRRRFSAFPIAVLVLFALAPVASFADPPSVPWTLSYQGLLLDDLAQPRTGSVDLTLRIHDALLGGTLLYTQHFSAVPLTDGVFTIGLGPTGEASDTPDDPLTTSLFEALAGDLGPTGPVRFLEVTVGSEGALARTQILSVPYALRAESAAHADTAQNADAVEGVPASFVSQLFSFSNTDATGAADADPSEGLADIDGDGMSNFIDPDNDGDSLSDGDEIAQGTDPNVATPVLDAETFFPPTADGFIVTTVTVRGQNFVPGLSVQFGSQTPTPTNVTPTQFDVDVGPQPPGDVPVTVTLPNGQSDAASFPFFFVMPVITGFDPPTASGFVPNAIRIFGGNFQPGLSVEFGDQTPTPLEIFPTHIDVAVEPELPGTVTVTVTLLNGESASRPFEFPLPQGDFTGVTVARHTQVSLSIREGGAGSGDIVIGGRGEYGVDTTGNGVPNAEFGLETSDSNIASGLTQGQFAVAWSPAGDLVGLRCRGLNFGPCDVELLTDSDGDLNLEDETPALLETLEPSFSRLWSPSLAFDGGKMVLGYIAMESVGTARVAHDRDGDGLFTGPNELVSLDTAISTIPNATRLGTNTGEVAVDPSGRVAYVYYRKTTGEGALRVAYDRSGDGDFEDSVSGNPELATLVTGIVECVGADFDPSGHLAVVYALEGGPPTLALDANGDGDFDDPDEVRTLAGGAAEACDVAARPTLAVAHNAGDQLRLLVDHNGDGDFDDTDFEAGVYEDVPLAGGNGLGALELRRDSVGRSVLVSDRVFVDPP